jgi:voltage-gated potassium channel
MRALRTAFNQFFVRNDIVWEALMGALVIVWLVANDQPPAPVSTFLTVSITIVFAVEFAVRFAASFDRLAYFKGHLIDLVTLIPALRGFRLLRLLVLLRHIRATRGLANQIGVLQYLAGDLTIRSLFIIWFSVMTVAAFLFFLAEHQVNPSVTTIFDAGWWALVTATTVGYGDITPDTSAGRIVGLVVMLVGIGTFSALAGLIGSSLQRRRAQLASGMNPDEIKEEEKEGTSDPKWRLRRLETLRGEGLITDEEYATKRAAVVADL